MTVHQATRLVPLKQGPLPMEVVVQAQPQQLLQGIIQLTIIALAMVLTATIAQSRLQIVLVMQGTQSL